MFWGVTIENDKRYTQTVEASFHLSMAALHPTPPTGLDLKTSSTVSLWVQHDKAEFLLCTLQYGVSYQQPLDCNFTEGEEVTFFLNGQGVIHLTGYLIEEMSMADESMEPMSESEEDSEESEDIPVLVDPKELSKGAKKRTKEMKMGSKKKCKVEEKDSDESSDDKSDSDDDDYEEEEDSDADIPEDSDDDSDDEKVTSKKSKKAKSAAAKNNASNSVKKPEQTKSKEQKMSEKLKNKVKKALSNSNRSADAEDSLEKALLDASILSEKKKKKKKKKQNKTSETSNDVVPNKKQESSSQNEESKSRVLSSGLAIEDMQVGQGSEARIGRQVHVYYSGKLAKTGKMFDRCINGKPFRFTLGRGEVISGWEKGLVGMRVGGKRTLTVPAKLGYGSQKMGPIPPNSSLIFDIELKAIS